MRVYGRDLRCATCNGKATNVAPDFLCMCDEPQPDTFYLMNPKYSRWFVTWICEGGHQNMTGKLDEQLEVVTVLA